MDAAGDGLTIGQVSRLLGVPVPTLRSWHLRYGVALPERTAGGHRRYARADIALLQALTAAVARGIAPSSAAQALSCREELSSTPVDLLARLLDHADAGSSAGVLEALDEGERLLGLEPAVHRLLVPALQEVGRRWEVGLLDVGCEHLVTAAARQWIARRTGTLPRPGVAPVLLAAAAGNRHTVALEALGMLLGRRGWPVCDLGADTPTESLVLAAETSRAQAVVVTAHQVTLRRPAVEGLLALASLRRARLFYAGGAFESPASRKDVPGHYLGSVLPEAADAVEAVLV